MTRSLEAKRNGKWHSVVFTQTADVSFVLKTVLMSSNLTASRLSSSSAFGEIQISSIIMSVGHFGNYCYLFVAAGKDEIIIIVFVDSISNDILILI